jgi:hypothetical protein
MEIRLPCTAAPQPFSSVIRWQLDSANPHLSSKAEALP